MAKKKTTTPVDEIDQAKANVAKKMNEIQEATQPSTFRDAAVNCKLLNVRKSPRPDATILLVLPENANVEVDKSKSTANFYKVVTESGVEGFCMKKFIKLKK